jgi:MarR family transcriptional regulator, organic hydroperoxide resistance regulator
MSNGLYMALICAFVAHKMRSRQQFQTLDLSEGQPKVLSDLYAHEGCLQKDLAEVCRVKPATMTVLLQNMVIKGLIQKKAVHVSGGKRAYGIYLTDLGREKAIKSIEIVNATDEASCKGFTEDEKNTLIELLQRVADNLS